MCKLPFGYLYGVGKQTINTSKPLRETINITFIENGPVFFEYNTSDKPT